MTQTDIAALLNCTVKLKFHFYVVALRTRVEVINAYLNEKIADLTGPAKSTAFYKMEKDMEIMLKIHKKVTDASRLVNGIYGFQELFSFVLYFVLLLSDGYIVLYSLTIGGDIDFVSVMAISLKSVVFHLIELLIDLRACMLLCAKVNHTKNVLFKIKIEPENEEARNIVMVAVFKLMHDKLVLTACDLFSMDFSFLFSMFASVTTYLLILLQFDIDAAKSRMAALKANLTSTQYEEVE
uniref:Gustatory receptor 2 n=2 Tax=Holotrichia parallela TaxID=93412 RepID=A0A2P9JYB0_HOLPA|nr:gustatory receptor 2 [Holotrichia parallela]